MSLAMKGKCVIQEEMIRSSKPHIHGVFCLWYDG